MDSGLGIEEVGFKVMENQVGKRMEMEIEALFSVEGVGLRTLSKKWKRHGSYYLIAKVSGVGAILTLETQF